MEFKRSTDEEFNRRILAMETVEIEGEQSFQTVVIDSKIIRDSRDYHDYYWTYVTLNKLKEQRDQKLPLESLFMRGVYLYDCAFLCIAAVRDDMIIFAAASSLYAISERDWEVWIMCIQPGKECARIEKEDWGLGIQLWKKTENPDKDEMPRYVTPLTVRGAQSFDEIVVEMGILVDGKTDGEFLVMTTETFSAGELKHTTNAEAVSMPGLTSWCELKDRYVIEKVCLLSVDGDEIRLRIGKETYTLSCCEKLDVISRCIKPAMSKVLTRIYTAKDGLPLYLSPEDAEEWKQRAGEKITRSNVLRVRTFEVHGTPSFHTIFVRYAHMDTQSSALIGGEKGYPAHSCPLDKLKGNVPALYDAGGGMGAFRFLAVDDDILYLAHHKFERLGRLATEVILLPVGAWHRCTGEPVNAFARPALDIFTEKGK